MKNSVWKKKEYIFNLVHAKPRSSSLNQPQFSWSSKAWTLAPQKYAQGRFGVLKEIVVSDKCSSTALSVYKGSILELRYIPVTKCGWECEQCSHTFFRSFSSSRCVSRFVLPIFECEMKEVNPYFRPKNLWPRPEFYVLHDDLPQTVSFDSLLLFLFRR